VFTELMPLLKQRAVMITISDVGEGLLRVNVIPRKLEGSADENGALTVPLSITGKAEELDRELPGQLTSFTESVTRTGSNIDELRTQHAAAVKAVEAENKKKIDDKKKGNGTSRTANTTPSTPAPPADFKDGKPLFGSKTAQAPIENGSLFDTPTSTEATTTVAAGGPSTVPQPEHPDESESSDSD
jgi:PRTRC genetic system protein E